MNRWPQNLTWAACRLCSPPCSPLSSGNVAEAGNLCLLSGSSELWEAEKEKINSGCLGFLTRPEPGLSLLPLYGQAARAWRPALRCAPPPSTAAEGLGPLLHTWDSGAAEAGAGLTGEVGPRTCPRSHMYGLASRCLG